MLPAVTPVPDLVALAVAVALLIGNAFFVGAEFALISARRSQIEPAAEAGSRSARLTLRAMDQVALMMAGAQLGITVCSLALGAVAEPAIAHYLEVLLEAAGTPAWLIHTIAIAISLAIVTYFHMVLGEMVPKNIAIAGPERSARVLGPAIFGVVFVLKPVIVFLNWFSNLMLRLVKVQPQDEVTSTFTEDQVADFIAESHTEGLLDDEEHQLLTGAVAISSEPVSAVAMPFDEVVFLEEGVTVSDAQLRSVQTGYSRFPVRNAKGNPSGYIHLKDLIGLDRSEFDEPVPQHRVRQLVDVDAAMSMEDALSLMQRHGAHMGLLREQGAATGAVTLQDLVDRITGGAGKASR